MPRESLHSYSVYDDHNHTVVHDCSADILHCGMVAYGNGYRSLDSMPGGYHGKIRHQSMATYCSRIHCDYDCQEVARTGDDVCLYVDGSGVCSDIPGRCGCGDCRWRHV